MKKKYSAYALSIILFTHSLTATDRETVTTLSTEEKARGQELIQAAVFGDQKRLATILDEHPSLIHYQNTDGYTPFMAATAWGRTIIMNKLIVAGADMNAQANDGLTALMRAADTERIETVDTLLTAGAPVNTHNKYGWTALMYAAHKGHTGIVNKLLSARADVNAQDNDSKTALMHAAQWEYTNTVRALLHAGADISIKNNDNKTTLEQVHEHMRRFPQSDFAAIVQLLQSHAPIEPEEETLMVKPGRE